MSRPPADIGLAWVKLQEDMERSGKLLRSVQLSARPYEDLTRQFRQMLEPIRRSVEGFERVVVDAGAPLRQAVAQLELSASSVQQLQSVADAFAIKGARPMGWAELLSRRDAALDALREMEVPEAVEAAAVIEDEASLPVTRPRDLQPIILKVAIIAAVMTFLANQDEIVETVGKDATLAWSAMQALWSYTEALLEWLGDQV